MALKPATSIISFFHKLEKQSCDLPLDTVRIFNKKHELTGFCFLNSNDADSIQQSLSAIVAEKGGTVSLSYGDSRLNPEKCGPLQQERSGPARKKDIEKLLQCEMDKTRAKRVPCAFIILRVAGKRMTSPGKVNTIDYSEFHIPFSASSMFHMDSGMAGLYGQKGSAASYSYDFYFVLPETGLNRAKQEIETVRGALRQYQRKSPDLKDCMMHAAVGVFYASDRITAAEMIGKVTAGLKKSKNKKGTVRIVTCASHDCCQVTVAERTQLFGFMRP